MKLIEIIISPDGHTRLETKGFAGGECREASRQMEVALGLVANDQATAEMYTTQSTGESLPLRTNSGGGP